MRNLAWFLAAFFITCALGLLTACTLPSRVPEPYEKRSLGSPFEDTDFDRHKRETAAWWTCVQVSKEC